jgi:hypothetical protein
MLNGNENSVNIQPLPAHMGNYYPFNSLLAGSFFNSDTSNSVVISWESLRNLGYIVDYSGNRYTLSKEDSIKGKKIITADSILGRSISLITATIDRDIVKNPLSILMKPNFDPFSETEMEYTIGGGSIFQVSGIF